MTEDSMWTNSLYTETAGLIFAVLVILGLIVFPLKKKNPHLIAAWASLKSWYFTAPLLFIFLALPKPWPIVALVLISIFSSKVFFQMSGMYHRTWFVWATYLGFIALAVVVYHQMDFVYDLSPMVFMGLIGLIPLMRNSAKHMIQYSALTFMTFVFFGWSLMHMGRLLMLEQGVLIVLYLYLLTEVSEAIMFSYSRILGRVKFFDKISSRFTLGGLVVSTIFTVLLAWGMRHLLPDRSEQYWLAAGLAASIFGRFGDLVISVVRRDLGIKETGVFILGRGDILARVDKLIFVGPIYFHLYLLLQKV